MTKGLLYHGDGDAPTSFGTGDCRYLTDSRIGLQRRDRFSRPHRLTTRRTTCSSAPAYNTAAVFLVRIGLQHRD